MAQSDATTALHHTRGVFSVRAGLPLADFSASVDQLWHRHSDGMVAWTTQALTGLHVRVMRQPRQPCRAQHCKSPVSKVRIRACGRTRITTDRSIVRSQLAYGRYACNRQRARAPCKLDVPVHEMRSATVLGLSSAPPLPTLPRTRANTFLPQSSCRVAPSHRFPPPSQTASSPILNFQPPPHARPDVTDVASDGPPFPHAAAAHVHVIFIVVGTLSALCSPAGSSSPFATTVFVVVVPSIWFEQKYNLAGARHACYLQQRRTPHTAHTRANILIRIFFRLQPTCV